MKEYKSYFNTLKTKNSTREDALIGRLIHLKNDEEHVGRERWYCILKTSLLGDLKLRF